MSAHQRDQNPRERGGLLGESRAERDTLPGLPGIGTIEIDPEEGLRRKAARGMTPAARWPLAHAADATPSPSASRSLVETARSATSIARRIMFARARPCVTTEIPATPRSGADTYGS